MKVFTVMFHTGSEDMIANVFASEAAAKECAEDCAASLFPANKFSWNGHFLTCKDRYEEWSVQDWTVKE
jgi:hypothetical protein